MLTKRKPSCDYNVIWQNSRQIKRIMKKDIIPETLSLGNKSKNL